jgi:hypothetical protein
MKKTKFVKIGISEKAFNDLSEIVELEGKQPHEILEILLADRLKDFHDSATPIDDKIVSPVKKAEKDIALLSDAFKQIGITIK